MRQSPRGPPIPVTSCRSEDEPVQAKSAIRFLSFRSTSPTRQACVAPAGGAAMDPKTVEITIKTYLTEMRSHLEKAASIAKAAEACAVSGSVEKGIEVALD